MYFPYNYSDQLFIWQNISQKLSQNHFLLDNLSKYTVIFGSDAGVVWWCLKIKIFLVFTKNTLHFLWNRYSVRIKEGFRDMFEVGFEVVLCHLSMSHIKIKIVFRRTSVNLQHCIKSLPEVQACNSNTLKLDAKWSKVHNSVLLIDSSKPIYTM